MITSITVAGWIILGILAITIFIMGYSIGKKAGVKITLEVQKIKGVILYSVKEVLDEWKIIRSKI